MPPSSGSPSHAGVAKAVRASRAAWINDLRLLLGEARTRNGDVCWRVEGNDDEIYGHKALLYARANAAFQTKFLNPNGAMRLQAIMSGSHLSLSHPSSPSPSPPSPSSPAGSHGGFATPSTQLKPIEVQGTEAAFFRALLDFLYTSSTDMKEAFTFLFEDAAFESDPIEAQDRLAEDLLFAWRSKLFADIDIQISETLGDIPDASPEDTSDQGDGHEVLFSTHRAILSVRCPYFSTIFASPYSDSQSSLYTLPGPPFTAASLHFTLGYIYTGSLSLNRTFDLDVAMQLWRSSAYLEMDLLRNEVEARIAEMCHDFRGCCRQCRARSTRVFCFCSEPDVNAPGLVRPARDVVVARFGDTWNREIGELDYETQKELIVALCQATTAISTTIAMKGILSLRTRLSTTPRSATSDQWIDHLEAMLVPLEDRIRHFLRTSLSDVVASPSFAELLDGVGFSNDVLEAVLDMLIQCQTEKTAALNYEVLVGKVLLREEGITMDARARVEDARQALLKYIKKRWLGIRAIDGFERLENWALKELSDEIEQPVDDLLKSGAQGPAHRSPKAGLKLATAKVHKVTMENDFTPSPVAGGPSSLRASVLNRNAARTSVASSRFTTGTALAARTPSASTSTPVRSVRQSASSSVSASTSSPAGSTPRAADALASGSTTVPARSRTTSAARVRTPSRSTPASPAIPGSSPSLQGPKPPPTPPLTPPLPSLPLPSGDAPSQVDSPPPPTRAPPPRPNSATSLRSASGSTSVRMPSGSSTKSVRTSAAPRGASRAPGQAASPKSPSRPGSTFSVRSRVTSAPGEVPPLPTPGAAATTAAATRAPVPVQAPRSTIASRLRTASVNSAQSIKATGSNEVGTKRPPSVASTAPRARPASVASVASTRTTASTRAAAGEAKKAGAAASRVAPARSAPSAVKKTVPAPVPAVPKLELDSPPAIVGPAVAKRGHTRAPSLPGSALKMGIPCVVTVGPTKFRATVRYLGEVLFADGSFVGVEVPLSQNEEGVLDRDDLKWHDGSVDGVRYFELDSHKPKSPFADRLKVQEKRRASNGRRTPAEEPASGPSKALFVDPSQVLYVF